MKHPLRRAFAALLARVGGFRVETLAEVIGGIAARAVVLIRGQRVTSNSRRDSAEWFPWWLAWHSHVKSAKRGGPPPSKEHALPGPALPSRIEGGEVAEWFNAAVLKTAVAQVTGSSNLPLSANFPIG